MNPSSTTMFSLLDQGGPFANSSHAPPTTLFSGQAREMAKMLQTGYEQTKYRVIRNQVFDLLDVDCYSQITPLLEDPSRRRQVTEKAYRLLGNTFGINNDFNDIVASVHGYAQTADTVIRYLKGKVLANFTPYIEMTNEIEVITNPVDLLLIIFNDHYHQKARFEAKRKLMLMNQAGAIDQRERETNIEAHFASFLDFLNRYVWSPGSKIGELKPAYVLSHHRKDDFSCEKWQFVDPRTIDSFHPGQNKKLTLLKRRRFTIEGRTIPIYVAIRKKPPEAKVLKLLRKEEENPAVAVDDELGLMAVLDNMADVKAFQNHLTRSARAADSFMVLEDICDSLTSSLSVKDQKNIGSSQSTRMLKFFARLGGMRVEFIVHTIESYLDYIYQRDVAHDEYEVKRIFDSGVADLLFPEDIYYLNMKLARQYQLGWFRRRIEDS